MKGLKILTVVLIDPSAQGIWERNWLELEGQLLEPVKRVTKPREFEVVLPYASCDIERNMGGCLVRLRRPDNGVDTQL